MLTSSLYLSNGFKCCGVYELADELKWQTDIRSLTLTLSPRPFKCGRSRCDQQGANHSQLKCINTQTDSGDSCKKCKNTTPTLSLSGQAASSDSTWCSEQTEKHTLARTHTHADRQTQTHTNTSDQCYHSLCKEDSSSAKATCCWRTLREAVVESSAHLALHTQSVILRVTHSAKA